ncbi:hypothetical protein GCM10022243_36720 [Saccharothrix violaceirubra]|uniref:Uncharacterized protein n=1 Tax=Saccharothrix violaceirubra TaxID=413306 RepID=A0A7W7T4L8_9PSEU|nr:hypothetical protein [Saccharothrix violaceirubra]MBB4966412.1 hypothetical protein [Saccharothrix violaceirubra]
MTVAWLWLRLHRWPTLVAITVATAAVTLLVGDERVPLPSFADVRRLGVPLGHLMPLLLASAVGLHSRAPTRLFLVTPRPARPQRAVLACVLVATASVAGVAGADDAVPRNILGLSGLALATAVAAGATRSWTLPLCHAMACVLFGSRIGPGGPRWWAFTIAPAGDRVAWAVALACGAAGTLLFVVRGPRAE